MTAFEPILAHQARLERMQFEAAERRTRALIDQCSPNNTPEMRVRVWERLHGVRLPKSATHAVLPQVAEQTALDITEVLEVQRLRALPPVIAT
jgi:hypothetical protein